MSKFACDADYPYIPADRPHMPLRRMDMGRLPDIGFVIALCRSFCPTSKHAFHPGDAGKRGSGPLYL